VRGTWLGYGTGIGSDVHAWATVSMCTVRIRTQEALAGRARSAYVRMHVELFLLGQTYLA